VGKLLTAKEREEKPQRTLSKAFTTEEIERHEQTGILAWVDGVGCVDGCGDRIMVAEERTWITHR
jgi:hypothetical protein